MAEVNKRPIIIVRRKAPAAGHHGGAWKVAYADFVTAMMAFFLVMWLVAAVSKEQRAAIFDYFKNPSMEQGTAPKPAPGQQGPGGASTSPINLRGGMDAPRSANQKHGVGAEALAQKNPTLDEAKKIAEAAERKHLESLMQQIKDAIQKSDMLKAYKDQLLLEITPEGLRIQIVDAQNRAMFDRGSSQLKDYTTTILKELSKYLNSVDNRLSITGHTDVTTYGGEHGFSNWELSAERANAARRAMVDGGLAPEKIARVVGLSSSVLFNRADPTDPINRRISIIVMTKQAEEAALATEAPSQTTAAAAKPASAAAGVPSMAAGTGAPASAAVQQPPAAAVAAQEVGAAPTVSKPVRPADPAKLAALAAAAARAATARPPAAEVR